MSTAMQDAPADLAERVNQIDWPAVVEEIDNHGVAMTSQLLSSAECKMTADLYDQVNQLPVDDRHGALPFWIWTVPLLRQSDAKSVAQLRRAFYPYLLLIARDWAEKLGRPAPWPDTLEQWLEMCHEAGQTRPTPILLRYRSGDWNALHRDLYGDLVFPLQVVIGLNQPGADHTGGEFLMVEQRPRAQSRGVSRLVQQGHALIFTTRERPVQSKRGWAQGPMRHGVSEVRTGVRHMLGLVFHDAA